MSIALPSPEDYERAMIEASGHYTVANVFYRDQDRAAIARRRLAQQWCEDDRRRAQRILADHRWMHFVVS